MIDLSLSFFIMLKNDFSNMLIICSKNKQLLYHPAATVKSSLEFEQNIQAQLLLDFQRDCFQLAYFLKGHENSSFRTVECCLNNQPCYHLLVIVKEFFTCSLITPIHIPTPIPINNPIPLLYFNNLFTSKKFLLRGWC